jgi:hypothetical protein
VTLTAPNGSTRVLNTASARFNEAAPGYLLFDLPITAAAEYGLWQVTVTPTAHQEPHPYDESSPTTW